MLPDTITLSENQPSQLVFTKRYPDANKSKYSVQGLSANAARDLVVSHEELNGGRVRSMISLDEVHAVPDSPTGATGRLRCYLVIDRPAHVSAALTAESIKRMETFIMVPDRVTRVLNLEV